LLCSGAAAKSLIRRLINMPQAKGWNQRSRGADWSELQAAARGRGAVSNRSGRFESQFAEPFDDGWGDGEDAPPALRTETIPERPKSILTYNTSPDIGFDRSINPYKGCEHGCIYCYARPNHAFRGLSAGIDFETRIFVKPNAAAVLRRELSRKSYKPAPIQFAGDTDIYQPVERDLKISRAILEVLHETSHPVTLITKSALILRDLDILAPMAERGLARAAISLTTLDRRLARAMEPRAAAPHRRLETIRALASAGVPVTVMTAPIVPALNDPEIEALLEAAAEAGATSAGWVMLRLPLEISDLFQEWLSTHYPDRAKRVMDHVRAMHAGQDYGSAYGVRQRGEGPYARLIADRFAAAARRLGLLDKRPPLRTDLFRPPGSEAAPSSQLSLFGEEPPERDG
jgi:DNA repair photolyase